MKGIIVYFSCTGNTKLVSEYIARQSKAVDFDLFDIAKDKMPPLERYDVIGFATFVDTGRAAQLMKNFMQNMPMFSNKPAFVFSTFANMTGIYLKEMAKLAKDKGLKVVSAGAVRMPQSYPRARGAGLTRDSAPSSKELADLNRFIERLNMTAARFYDKQEVVVFDERIGVIDKVLTAIIKNDNPGEKMGDKFVDKEKCTKCGLCSKECPYKAISDEGFPVFNQSQCFGCWKCYNKCPQKAVYVENFREKGHYAKPSDALKDKLKLEN